MTGPTIAVDAMGLGSGVKGGPRALLSLLRELPQVDPGLRYVALLGPGDLETVKEAGIDIASRVQRPARGLVWELGASARAARGAGADLLYTTREITFAGRRKPLRVVLHLHEPPWYRNEAAGEWPARPLRAAAKDQVLHTLVGPALHRAHAVVASSKATADALEARFGLPAEVVHLGIDQRFLDATPVQTRQRFLLHLSSGDPRDNTARVIRAWGRVRPPGFRLQIAGVPGHLQKAIRRLIEAEALDSVDVAGWLTEQQLVSMYDRCWALLGPSLYEGFGLEPLEAMARGAPVIAGDLAASREVLGDAALFCDSRSVQSIERAVREIIEVKESGERLRKRGLERSERFRWITSARRLTDVFHRILAASSVSK